MNDILPTARQFARYSLTRELRRDVSTVTWLALDPVMHREVVLKVVQLPLPAALDGQLEAELAPLEQAFMRQAQAAGKLNHPHIVTVYEAGRIGQQAFLAIERVMGRPLAELLASGWRPQLAHAVSIAARVADALEHAHSQGVTHGHLSAQHVLLQASGVPKVEGFGGWIDTGTGGEDALHRTRRLLPYFESELSEDVRRRDVQALASLVLMLAGAPARSASAPASPSGARDAAPDALVRLVNETLRRGDRCTAGDLRDALTAFLWKQREPRIAPATLGIPLAAPPADLAAASTTPLQSGPAAAPAPLPKAQQMLREQNRPPGEPHTVRVVRPAARSERTAAAAAAPNLAAQWLAGLRRLTTSAVREGVPQLWRHRLVAGSAAAVAVLALLIGILLGNPVARAPAAPEAPVPAAPTPVGIGVVTLDIQPWGEVFVNGKPTGVAPPMTELRLRAGRHAVEIRYGEKASVSFPVDVDPDRPRVIAHRFE